MILMALSRRSLAPRPPPPALDAAKAASPGAAFFAVRPTLRATMKWLVTILAALVGVLLITTVKLASVKHVDPSSEALLGMATLREALQVCEATKRQADLDAPAAAPAPALEEAKRSSEMRGGESRKQKCLLEAERLGKAAALWCAGL